MIYNAKSDIGGTISAFNYRKKITINHSGALTSYQMKLIVDHVNTNMKTDFGDIRFNTEAGNYIPYWIETQVNDTSADVWIKTNLVDGNTIIYMFYGNTNLTSASSISNTFIHEISGVVGAWDLNGDTLDMSGNGNNGTLIGGMGYAAGIFGQAGHFENAGDYVEVPHSPVLQPITTGTFSLSAWIKRGNDASGTSAFTVISKTQTSGSDAYVLAVDSQSTNKLDTEWNGNMPWKSSTGTILFDNNWYHVILTVIGNNGGVFYINGNASGTFSAVYSINQNTENVRIGGMKRWGTNAIGLIGRVRMYYGLLTADDATAIGNSTNIGYVTTNYPGRELVRKYTATEPTYLTSAEQTITSTYMSIIPRESPCRVGTCIIDVHVTWTNTGESVVFTPSIIVDGNTYPLSPIALSIGDTIIDFEVSGLTVGTHSICPDPN